MDKVEKNFLKHNILYVEASKDFGGSTVCLYNMLRYLDRNVYKPFVVCIYPGRHFERLVKESIDYHFELTCLLPNSVIVKDKHIIRKDISNNKKENNLRGVNFFIFYLKWIVFDLLIAFKLFRKIKHYKIDLVHLNNGPFVQHAGIFAAWLAGIPCICHLRSRGGVSALCRKLSRWVDQYIPISNLSMNEYIQQGIPQSKCIIIYDGYDMDINRKFYMNLSSEEIKNEFKISKTEIVIGTIGRLIKLKGHKYLIDAFKEILPIYNNIKLLIVGDNVRGDLSQGSKNGYRQELENYTEELGVRNNVLFTGFRTDIFNLLSVMDIFIHTSLGDAFGIVLLEAMIAGRPIIATNAGGASEIINNKITGILIPPGDSKKLSQAIIELIENKTFAKKLAINAKVEVMKKFDFKKTIVQIQQIYDKSLHKQKY